MDAKILPDVSGAFSEDTSDPALLLAMLDKKYEHFLMECMTICSSLLTDKEKVEALFTQVDGSDSSNKWMHTAVVERLQTTLCAETEKAVMRKARLMIKRKGLGGDKTVGLTDLAGMRQRQEAETRVRELGVDPNTFMDEKLSPMQAAGLTVVLMTKMLSVVVVFALCAWGMIGSIAAVLSGVSIANPLNTTGVTVEEEDEMLDDRADRRNRISCMAVAAWLSFGIATWALGLPLVFGVQTFTSYVKLFIVSMLPLVVVTPFFEFWEYKLDSMVFASISCVSGTSALLAFLWQLYGESEVVSG